MAYDDIGNITGKSDVGTYSYHSQKVHAVDSIETDEPPLLFSDQRIEYNYMNLPLYIADEDDSLVYTYGAGNNRIKARLFSGGQLVRTTWYGDNFERVVEGSVEKFYHWILSPDGPVALVVTVTGGSTTYYYLCRDHLNSITGIMDASGAMLEEYSYDPWGRRRSPADWLTTDVSVPGITTRGYTGHEHLDDFGLIHMNGRIYDPHVGRILNPDPIIQEPLNIQNYNRYSYCLNNPLKYTDPSGYTPRSIDIWKAYLKESLKGYNLGYQRFYDDCLNQYYEQTYGGRGAGGNGTGKGGTGTMTYTFGWWEKVNRPLDQDDLNYDNSTDAFIIGDVYSILEHHTSSITIKDFHDNDGLLPQLYGTNRSMAIPDGEINTIGAGFAFLGGMSIEYGTVTDKKGGRIRVKLINGNIGYGLGGGYSSKNIYVTENDPDGVFTVNDFINSYTHEIEGGFFVFNFSKGWQANPDYMTPATPYFLIQGGGLTFGLNYGAWWSRSVITKQM